MKKPIIDNSITDVRSDHNLSCNWTGTADFGRLVPFHIEELVPTDHVKTCHPKIEMQMLPLASPTFGKLSVYVHYFFVPHRLTFPAANDIFERQGVGQNDTWPYITLYDLAHFYQSLPEARQRAFYKHWTSLGLPPFFELAEYNNDNEMNNHYKLTMLKFRAYQQIWWDFYRDPEVLRDASKDNYLNTSSSRWKSTGLHAAADQNTLAPKVRNIKDVWLANLFASAGYSPTFDFANGGFSGSVDPDSGYEFNSLESQIDYSKLSRKVEALTRLSERLSLGGKRAIDAMFAAYGVKPNFLKMNMAQYVGGAKSTVLVSDITSSADTVQSIGSDSPHSFYSGGLPLGAKAGTGYCSFNNLNIEYTAQEHGYLVGILSVMPEIHFNQGLSKTWLRNSLDDFFNKSLERTGLVAVSKAEVGFKSANSPSYVRDNDISTFAFDQPYYEYKRGTDVLAGDFAKYHNASIYDDDDNLDLTAHYMQSMEMYVDFPVSRNFNADNLTLQAEPFNKIFYYLGGSLWTNTDDHFHLCIDKDIVINRPMDGFAVPTLETTKDPHKASSPVGGDTVL